MRPRTSLVFIAILVLTASVVFAQKKVNRFEDAQERSQDAAKVIDLLSVLRENEMPKEVVDRALAVGVFPKVNKESMLFTTVTQGYGVISARTETGWTLPAFYEFSGGGYGGSFARSDTAPVILLFMTKDALAWFEKGGVKLRSDKKAIQGPVGKITDEQRKRIEGAQILAYSFYEGRLNGDAFGTSFWKTFLLNPDNKINVPLYGMKGREVLAGKKVQDSPARPSTIPTFTEALQKYYAAAPKSSASN